MKKKILEIQCEKNTSHLTLLDTWIFVFKKRVFDIRERFVFTMFVPHNDMQLLSSSDFHLRLSVCMRWKQEIVYFIWMENRAVPR